MQIEPYLLLGDVEVANSLRTLTYLRRGLAGAAFDVALESPLVVAEGGGYDDVYSDSYGYYLDSYRTQNLRCFCAAIDTGPYHSPAGDGAPWYDAARPESGQFLGMLSEATLLPVATRGVTRRVGGGASIGALSLGPRIVAVEGVLYASSKAAMSYGERWLRRVLTGGAGCGEDTLTILPACAPEEVDDGSSYLRELAAVGVVDGPIFGEVSAGVPECVAQTVAFQLAAGDPYLRALTNLLDEPMDHSDQCATLAAPLIVADSAAVVTVEAGSGDMNGVTVTGTTDAGDVATVTIEALPAGTTLVMDSSRRIVEVVAADGAVVGGLDYVDFDGTFPWLVAAPGTELEVCVDSTGHSFGGGASVRIDQVDREL